MLELKVTNQEIELVQVTPLGSPLVSGSAGEYECFFEFDETWNGFIKTAVFEYSDSGNCNSVKHEPTLIEDNKCGIPVKALKKGNHLRIGVYGIKGDTRRPTVYTEGLLVRVGAMPVTPENDPSPEIYVQILNMIEKVGVPKGGTSNQVLAKKSDNDYDVEWVEQTGGKASSWDGLTNKPFDEFNTAEMEVDGLKPNRQLGIKEIPQSKVTGLEEKLNDFLLKDKLAQTTGSETTNTMSQDAITKLANSLKDELILTWN